MSTSPTLSVLVPAYEHPEGVERILAALARGSTEGLEVIVADDSRGDAVGAVAERYRGRLPLRYARNDPPRGACANWNALLDEARGDYLLLLHHDEYPATPGFVDLVRRELMRDPGLDALVLEVLLVRGARAVRHMPGWARRLVVRRAPRYLLRRNLVGSPSALVIRRQRYPRYDGQLRWLVDVEAYLRLLRERPRVGFSQAAVGSVPFARSITRALGTGLREVHRRELALVRARHPGDRTVALLTGAGAPGRALLALETVAWLAFRAAWSTLRRLAPVHLGPAGEAPPAAAGQGAP